MEPQLLFLGDRFRYPIYMRYSLLAFLAVLHLAAVISAVVVSRYAPISLRLGLDRGTVEGLLRHAGAEDLSDGMSTYTVVVPNLDGTLPDPVETKFNRTGMWHLASINLTIETEFVGGKLVAINLWDWTGRELDRYLHLIEYDSASELTVPVLHGTYSYKIVETHNPGINPPQRIGG